MKKIFTLLSLMMLMFAVSANAQQRKTWDFSKGVSDESRAALDADGTNWSSTKNTVTMETVSWASNTNINGQAMAGGNVVKELSELYFSDFAATNALLYRITCIRLQKNCAMTIKGLNAGQKIVIKASSANGDATDRGFSLNNATDAEGNTSFTVLGAKAAGAPEGGVTVVEATVTNDGDVKLSTGVNGAPKCGIDILSIVIDEGDKNIKKWDFSAWSEATVAQVCGAEDWTTSESASKNYISGNEIRWISAPAYDANEDLTAGGTAIKEMKGLRYEGVAQYGLALAFDYQNLLDGNQDKGWGPFSGGKYLWVCNAANKIIVPNVKLGSTLKLGVETHKLLPAGTSEGRGFSLIVSDKTVAAQTATDYAVLEYAIPTDALDEDGDGYVDVTLVATKGCHLYSIEAEVKDETVVDKNPRLGVISYSPKTGNKIAVDGTTVFSMSFPKASNIDLQTPVAIEGKFTSAAFEEPVEFDGITGTIGEGITITFSDFGVDFEPGIDYTLTITKLVVGEEGGAFYLAQDLNDELKYATPGLPIETVRSWEFTLTQETAEAIAQSIDAGNSFWAASSKGRYSVKTQIQNSPIYISEGVELPNTAGLIFTMSNANDILFGTPSHTGVGGTANGGGNNGKMQCGGGVPVVTIPQCAAGDEITVKALWSTKNAGTITITNGTCNESNAITLTGSAAEYKITVAEDGDVLLASKNTVYNSISIYPVSMGKEKVVYTINATNADGAILKEIATGEGQSNDKIDYGFSYYLMDKDGAVYTKGTRGTPFSENITLETGKETYNVEYSAANIAGLVKGVFCAEAEELEGTIASTSANCGIRASNAKAAYPDAADITLCTLPAGTYMIRALIWDANKGGGVATMKFSYGDNAEDIVEILSSSDNMSICDAATPLVLEEARQIVWLKEGTSDAACLDAILIYEYDEESDVNAAIADVKANVKAIKCVENGAIVIKTANGTFNLAGMQLK